MWLNIVEICRSDDKRANFLIQENQRMGWSVYEFGDKIVTVFATDNVWKSPTAQFKHVPSGTYVFRDNQFVKV